MRRNSATAVGSQVTTATGPVSPPSIQQISHVGKKSLPSPPLRVCCCKPAFSIHLVSGSRLQKPDGFCIPSAALRHYSCEGLPLALITCFAAVRWCGANGAIVTSPTGRWGCAAPILILIGSYPTGTMGCTMGTPSKGFFWYSFYWLG